MSDKQLQDLMDKTIKFKKKYYNYLDKLEGEYVKRFGVNPSEIDDDEFIDTFHYKQGDEMKVDTLINNVEMHKSIRK